MWFYHLQVFGNSAECRDSAETAKIVKVCPQNINEWVEAAKNEGRKKCQTHDLYL